VKITPRSRRAWRDWLLEHHADAAEVWLVFYKRHTGKPTLSYNDAVEEALCFGWIDGIRKSVDDERYMHRFSPRKPGSKWSASNRQRVARMTEAGLMMPAGQKAVAEAQASGRWDAPARPDIELAMPPELGERLAADAGAAEFFESLAPSYRRQFIAWVAMAKRPETRQRRAAEALDLLRAHRKLGMR
jgi:uncharacterized protein YdeI (YjbR/CyaY-like superfamily)